MTKKKKKDSCYKWQYVLLGVTGDLRLDECRELYTNVPRSVCNNVKTLRFWLCERRNGPFGSIKGGEYLSDYQLVKEDRESRGTHMRCRCDTQELRWGAGVHVQTRRHDVSAQFRHNTHCHFLTDGARWTVRDTHVHPCICWLHAAKKQGATQACMQRLHGRDRRFTEPPAGITRDISLKPRGSCELHSSGLLRSE